MAQRVNLVPNNVSGSGIGSTLGTEAKRWDTLHARTGSIDVIPMNAAGYGSLVKDINTTITIN